MKNKIAEAFKVKYRSLNSVRCDPDGHSVLDDIIKDVLGVVAEERSKVIETVKEMKASEYYLDKCLKISKECYDREFYVNKSLDYFIDKLNQSK